MHAHLRLILAVLLVAGTTSYGQGRDRRGRRRPPAVFGMTSRLGLGVRLHPPHATIEKWPFDDNFSYGLSYALFEGLGYLELGVDYAPEGAAETVIDDVWTPRLNMAVRDGVFVAGTGIASAYVNKLTGAAEWIGPLYQFHLGVEIPLGTRFELGIGAYYSFDSWDGLRDFDISELEYGVRLGYLF